MCGRGVGGVCVVGGMCAEAGVLGGRHAWQGGACMAGGMHNRSMCGRGYAW